MESILSEFQRSGTLYRTSFEEWERSQEPAPESDDLNMDRLPGGDDLNMDRLPGGDDLNMDRLPGGDDLNMDRLPGGDDLNMDRLPGGDDLNLDRLPGGDDLNMDRLPGGDDLNLDRLPDGDDLNMDRLPGGDDLNLDRLPGGADLNLDRLPGGDDLNIDRLPGGDDLNLDRLPGDDNSTIDALPTDIPINIPLTETSDAPIDVNDVIPMEVSPPTDSTESLPSSGHSSYSLPSQGSARKSIPKCPKIQDLDKTRKKKPDFPSVPVVSPLSVMDHSYPSSSTASHSAIMPSPTIAGYQSDSSVRISGSCESTPPVPEVPIDLYHQRNVSSDYTQNYMRGTSSVSSRGNVDSMDRYRLSSPGQGYSPPGVLPILPSPVVPPSPGSFISNPGVFFTEAEIQFCCAKLNRISSTLSYFVSHLVAIDSRVT